MEYVEFGRTGLRVSRLAFGTGTNGGGHSSDQTRLGSDALTDLLRLAHDHGVTFFDRAYAREIAGIENTVSVAVAGLDGDFAQLVREDPTRLVRVDVIRHLEVAAEVVGK